MANLTDASAANRTLQDASPPEKLDISQDYGRVRVLYDSYTFDAADELASTAILRLFDIPANARLLAFKAYAPESASTGKGAIGWAASADGGEVADPDGIMASVEFDPGGGLISGLDMLAAANGFNKKFTESVQVQVAMDEITADSGGDKWEFLAYIAVD